MPSNEEVRGKPWYYGPISRGDCDNLMAERGQDGDFLVRDSESNVSITSKILLGYFIHDFNIRRFGKQMAGFVN